MAGGRRGLGRNVGLMSKANPDVHMHADILRKDGVHPVAYLKHVPIPDIPYDSDWFFECFLFGYHYLGMILQYLYLYRTVWWLPHSYTRYAVNFYLIDPYLVLFVGTLLSIRLVWSLTKKSVINLSSVEDFMHAAKTLRILVLSVISSILIWCSYYIIQNHTWITIVCLCYPLIVYLILFGPVIEPLLEILPEYPDYTDEQYHSGIMIQHVCRTSADDVRSEVNFLRSDFNERIKRALLSSLLSAYCAGFIPCCFAQNFLHYEVSWVTQHLVFLWLGSLTMHLLHCFPPRYCDVLHRSAIHLGKWNKLEGRPTHLPYSHWLENSLWGQGSLVKYQRELYRSESICTAAEPGNPSHYRFYLIFSNSSVLSCCLLGLQLTLVLLQGVQLIRSSNWERLVSISLLMFANYVTLFRLLRGYILLWKTHRFEHLILNQHKVS